jgi:hypothetical protein
VVKPYSDFKKQINSLPLEVRPGKFYTVYGGPYREKPMNMTGVKMAMEIMLHGDGSREISIPTKDFHTPDAAQLRAGLIKAVRAIVRGEQVYVGCMAGRGRTGLFLAVLAKAFGYQSPIAYVRREYYSHAVETAEQMQYVADFKIPRTVKWLLKWGRFKARFNRGPLLTRA